MEAAILDGGDIRGTFLSIKHLLFSFGVPVIDLVNIRRQFIVLLAHCSVFHLFFLEAEHLPNLPLVGFLAAFDKLMLAQGR